MKAKSNFISVEFNCSNGWDKVYTSIPSEERNNAKHYLETVYKFSDVHNIIFDSF